MNRAFFLVVLLAATLCAALGSSWIAQPPSNQELLANTAKAIDYLQGWKDVGGPPWWTPHFLQGSSLAPTVTFLVSSVWILLWVSIFGLYTGAKIAGLLSLVIGSAGVFCWIRRLVEDELVASISAIAFVLCPSVFIRLGGTEHMVFVSALAVMPWLLWSTTRFVSKPTIFRSIIMAGMAALLLITYSKAAALLLPVILVYVTGLWIAWQRGHQLPWKALFVCAFVLLLLGVLPNLPALREMKFATLFEIAPLEGWQHAYSIKSDIVWLDRSSFLSDGAARGFTAAVSQGSNYLGLIPALLLLFIFWRKPKELYTTRVGGFLRFLITLFLVAHWLSFGPFSVFSGMGIFLKMSFGVADPVIALAWLLLLVQPWIIYCLLPENWAGRPWIAALLSIIYIFIPGFRLLSWLPLYSQIRAPHDFSQIVGILFIVPAIGCACALFVRRLPKWQPILLALAGLLTLLDISPYFHPFFRPSVDAKTIADFNQAEAFLAKAPIRGWVFSISGRYFDSLTPVLSGRGLSTEAFSFYQMIRGMSYLQATSFTSPDRNRAYLKAAGIAYILIDKFDPDRDELTNQRFYAITEKVFENDNFLILANPKSLAPAYLAQSFIVGSGSLGQIAGVGLDIEKYSAVALPDFAPDVPDDKQIGRLTETSYDLTENLSLGGPRPFVPMQTVEPSVAHYQRVELKPTDRKGWIVVTQAFHPDWRAYSGEKALAVVPADGGLLAVQSDGNGKGISLRFEPPWWYNASLALSGASWLGWLGFIAVGPFAKGNLRRRLHGLPEMAPATPPSATSLREAIRRPLVVIPTYNEALSLPAILELLFAVDAPIHILIVDDNSPDGTAAFVRQHSEYEKRLFLLSRAGKLGLGSAYREGFRWAFERNYDACLEMDADLSHDPRDVPRLIQTLNNGADLALGSRYLGGVRVMNWPEHRLLLSTTASRFVQFATGMPVSDATSGFKAIRTSVLQGLDWANFRTGGYGFQVELHYFLWRSGAVIHEVPIVFTERRDGETKMSLSIAIEAAVRTLQLAWDARQSAARQRARNQP